MQIGLLVSFAILIFAIIGLEFYTGALHKTCYSISDLGIRAIVDERSWQTDLSDTVVQMSGSTCSNTRRQLPEMQESQDTKIQDFFYIPSRVDQLQKESTVKESEKEDEHTKDVEDGFDDTNPVDSENAIDNETDSRLEFDGVDKTSSDLVLPKEPPKKYLYSYFVPQLIFHPISHPMFMPYIRPQPYHYHPLCFPYC